MRDHPDNLAVAPIGADLQVGPSNPGRLHVEKFVGVGLQAGRATPVV